MRKMFHKIKKIVMPLILLFSIIFTFSCGNNKVNVAKSTDTIEATVNADSILNSESRAKLDEFGSYTSKEDVALYIYTYKKLPPNFITKDEAKALGWNSSKGNLGKVAKGKSIGGDVFGNYEKILPVINGRKYYECDIDYKGKKRNAKRIIYADDFDENIGFIYYTDDHYKTFERLY